MSRTGSDVEQLRSLGALFRRHGERLQASGPAIGTVLGGVPWTGPDAQAFRASWSAEHAPALRRVAARVVELGTAVTREADEQVRGSEGGSSGSVLDVLRNARQGVSEWLQLHGPLHAELSELTTTDLLATLDAEGSDPTTREVARALLEQRFGQLHSEELDGAGSRAREAELGEELVDLGSRLADPSSYAGRGADEARAAALMTELEASAMRRMSDLGFGRERSHFERLYEAADPETREALSARKMLIDLEHERRGRLDEVAAGAAAKTRRAIDRYVDPFNDDARRDVEAEIQGVIERGGPTALARYADQLNSVLDERYGSKLNRHLQILSTTPEGAALAKQIRASHEGAGREVFDHVAEGPSFVKEVVVPTVDTGLDFVPVIGNVKGLIEGAVGYKMTGEKLSALDRGLGVLGPFGAAAKKGAAAFKAIGGLGDASKAADRASDLARTTRADEVWGGVPWKRGREVEDGLAATEYRSYLRTDDLLNEAGEPVYRKARNFPEIDFVSHDGAHAISVKSVDPTAKSFQDGTWFVGTAFEKSGGSMGDGALGHAQSLVDGGAARRVTLDIRVPPGTDPGVMQDIRETLLEQVDDEVGRLDVVVREFR